MIIIDGLTASRKNDRKYLSVIQNLEEELENRFVKSGRSFKNYKIAIVLTKFDQIKLWKYRKQAETFVKKNCPRLYKCLEQLKKEKQCSIAYFACSAFGMINEPPEPNAIFRDDIIINNEYLFILKDPESWKPFGLISPIYWLLTNKKLNQIENL